jgi:hypothetical protein
MKGAFLEIMSISLKERVEKIVISNYEQDYH